MSANNPKRSYLKQQLWKIKLAQKCVARVRAFCDHYLSQQPAYESPLYHGLMTAICVVYAKPFTDNKTVGMLSEKFGRYSDSNLTDLHHQLLTARDRLYAHNEPDLLKIHIRVEAADVGEMMEYKFYPQVEETHFDPKCVPNVLRMCDEIEPKLEKKFNELMNQLFGERHWPAGRFTLNLNDES